MSISSVDDDAVFGIPSTRKESALTEERVFFCHKEIMGANYSLTIAAAEIHQRQNVFKQIRHKILQANQLQKERITREREREREREKNKKAGNEGGLSHPTSSFVAERNRRDEKAARHG